MSTEAAIAAVTITLRNLLEPVKHLSDPAISSSFPADAKPSAEIVVNNLPLHEAYEFDKDKNQVNIFLYHVELSPDWRNRDIPGQVRNGESAHPPLGLKLYYIITTYGQKKSEIISHLLLGKVMSILHDHPVFSREEIETAFPGSHLHEQIERVRITSQPISLEDVSKLWTGFQTQYQLSVAYQVSVVLIESKRPARTPLPVLTRGPGDIGVFVQPFVIPPYPTLESVQYPRTQHGVQPGDELLLKGHDLKGDSINLIFKHMITGLEFSRAVSGSPADQEIKFTIPNNEPNLWSAGLYSVKAIIHKAGKPDKTSNDIPFTLIPLIVLKQILPLSPFEPNGYVAAITFSPNIQPRQTAYLLLSDNQFKAPDHAVATSTLNFEMRNVSPGDYHIRLRIDGADSQLIIDTVTPPVFNPALKISLP